MTYPVDKYSTKFYPFYGNWDIISDDFLERLDMKWNVIYGDSFFEYLKMRRYGWEKTKILIDIIGSYGMGSRPRQVNNMVFSQFEKYIFDKVRRDLLQVGILRKNRRLNGHRFRFVYDLNPYFYIPTGTKKKRVQDDWDNHVFELYSEYDEYKAIHDKYPWTTHDVIGLWI